MREKRKKIWIDRFQTQLFLRIALYFVLYQVAVWSLVAIEHNLRGAFETMLGPAGGHICFFLAALTVVFMGFLFIYDALTFAHRIVGPLYRVRKTIQAVTAGEEMEPMRFRDGDYLQELRDDFNEMLRALEQRGAIVMKEPQVKQGKDQSVQPVG